MPKPNQAIQAAAKKARRFKEEGKAKGAGTNVGWTRAAQLAKGEEVSMDTVKRMYSYLSRHAVDKKGQNFGNDEKPSKGYVMWLAWGGDPAYKWAKNLVEKEKNKN
jgi:hypothetical protein